MEMPADPNREKAIKVKYDQLSWFEKQFPVLVEKFKPFLRLESGRFPLPT